MVTKIKTLTQIKNYPLRVVKCKVSFAILKDTIFDGRENTTADAIASLR